MPPLLISHSKLSENAYLWISNCVVVAGFSNSLQAEHGGGRIKKGYIEAVVPFIDFVSQHSTISNRNQLQSTLSTFLSHLIFTLKMTVKTLEVRPLGLSTGLGAIIENADIENLNDADFATIRDALYQYNVVVLKGQSKMSPLAQHTLTNKFDPSASSYGHGKTLDAKKSVLHPDLKTCPAHPTVQIIGNGTYTEDYEGLKAPFTLKHRTSTEN